MKILALNMTSMVHFRYQVQSPIKMMALVPTANNPNNVKNPNAEKVCDMLQEVIDQHLNQSESQRDTFLRFAMNFEH